MNKLILTGALVLIGLFSIAQKTEKEIKKEISSKAIKSARKEAKKFKKQGWDVIPGSLPLDKILEKSYIKLEEETSKGGKKYIYADGNGLAETKSAAELQASTLAKLALAKSIESKVSGLLTAKVANNQLNNEDAVSITKTLMNSHELIAAQLGYVEEVFKIYRTPANPKNSEVQIRIFYDIEQSLQIAKKVIQKELKDELKINEDQLNKLMGIE
jgi:hypothetical protein